MKTYDELVEENAALAAHVERLKGALGYAMLSVPEQHSYKADLRDARDSSPETSLARRDARMKAEALEQHATDIARENDSDDMVSVEDVHDMLLDTAQRIRHQAGEES